MSHASDFAPLTLPARPLTVVPEALAPARGIVLTLIVLLALAGGLTAWQGPALWRDIQISRNPVTLHDAQVLDGRCSTRRGITDCSARLVYTYQGRAYDTHSEMAFVDFSSSDYLVDVVISADRPELATMSIGLEKLWNRGIVFAVFILLFGGGAVGVLVQAWRNRRHRRDWQGAARLDLVPVTITQVQNARGAQIVTYRPASGPAMVTRFTGFAGPLSMPDATGTMKGVAVRREGVASPVLLDEVLDRLDLTADERASALSQIATTTTRTPGAPVRPRRNWRRRVLLGVLVLVLIAAGLVGYWLWYVTSGDAFNTPGKEINAIMPSALNQWGCDQLHARFPKSHPPTGCVGVDFSTWR